MKLKQSLLSNLYSILFDNAPPTCQVKEQDDDHSKMVYNTDKLDEGLLNGSIPSAFVESAAASNIGTKKDQSRNDIVLTGQQLDKAFCMPNEAVDAATATDELHHEVQPPAKDVHIVPAIERKLLISIPKFANANNIATFDKDKVTIYDVNTTKITVIRAVILQGWCCNKTKLWCIPLVKHMQNNNTETVLCNHPPMWFLPEQPPTTKAIENIYKLKTQPELVCYHHAAVGFPIMPTWVRAIKNRQFALWPGLTAKAVTKHFLESEEKTKGHGHKTQSGLRSTKTTTGDDMYIDNEDNNTAPQISPTTTPHHKTVQGIHKNI